MTHVERLCLEKKIEGSGLKAGHVEETVMVVMNNDEQMYIQFMPQSLKGIVNSAKDIVLNKQII